MQRQPCATAPAALERAKNIGLAHLSAALFFAARFCARFIRAIEPDGWLARLTGRMWREHIQ